MKINFIFACIGILLLLAIMPSCNKNDDVFYEISATINSLNFDSVRDSYGERVKNSDYPFTIDLDWKADTALISNKDSLPYRSDLTRTLLTFNSPATVYRYTEDGYVLFISRQDTLDCNQPVLLKAVGSDAYGNTLEKKFKVVFNVHQVNPDLVSWQEFTPNITIEGKQKSLIHNGQLFLFLENGSIYSASLSNATEWSRHTSGLSFDYASATLFAERIYLVAEGNVYASVDGSNWEIQPGLSNGNDVETLLGSTDQYLSGIKNGYYCSTTGLTWEESGISSGNFERTWPSSVTYSLTTNPNIQQIAVLGLSTRNPSAHALLVAEDKLLNWAIWGPVDSAATQLPDEPRMALIRYRDNKFYSFGGSSPHSFQQYYTSDGLYWAAHTNRTFFPGEFSDRAEFSAVVDPENYIWMIFSESYRGKAVIYKGRFNSYNF